MHQTLMHGRSRSAAGCTVDALPKVDEDFEALREMSLPWYAPDQFKRYTLDPDTEPVNAPEFCGSVRNARAS